MKAEIISVGTELLLGTTINTDAADVALLLSEYGINVYWQTVVGDNPGRVIEAVRRARERADIIITTGGLGAHLRRPDQERSRRGLRAEAGAQRGRARLAAEPLAGAPLLPVHPRTTCSRSCCPRAPPPLRNDWGTAPGCTFKAGDVLVIMLPGPPRECRPMLEYRVRPILAGLSDSVIASHNIHFFGIGESEMEYRLRDYMEELTNPTLAPYAKQGECLVRVTASAPTREKAEEMMAPVVERVLGMFGPLAYGMDCANLAEYTTKLMIERGVTVAAAESCTGGEFTKAITDIPGASSALLGGVVVYTNEAKHKLLGVPQELLDTKGAVSFEVAVELARRVREKLGSTFGVGITGLAGPDGDGVHEVGTVFISLADGGKRLGARETHHTARKGPGASLRLPERL